MLENLVARKLFSRSPKIWQISLKKEKRLLLGKKIEETTTWVFLQFVSENWAWSWTPGDLAIHICLAPDVGKPRGAQASLKMLEQSQRQLGKKKLKIKF
jgi:hypothetical protein